MMLLELKDSNWKINRIYIFEFWYILVFFTKVCVWPTTVGIEPLCFTPINNFVSLAIRLLGIFSFDVDVA